MLTLTRRVGETLYIGEDTVVVVEAIEHGKVRIRVQSEQTTRTVNVHRTRADRPVHGVRTDRVR
jgi:carbon storage regulator CsrA